MLAQNLPRHYVIVCVTVIACNGPGAGSVASRVEVVDSAGVRLILNASVAVEPPTNLVATESLRIGSREGEDPFEFFRVADLVVDTETGEIYVGNAQTGTVRVFSGAGQFLREFGGRGRGPGEVQSITRVWVAGEHIGVTDRVGTSRTHLFSRQGDLVSSWSIRQPDRSFIEPWALGPQGWIGLYEPPRQVVQTAPEEVREQSRDLFLIDPDKGEVRGVAYEVPPIRLFRSTTTHGLDWPLFEPNASFGVDWSGNVYVSRGFPYRVDVYAPDGGLVRGIMRRHDSVAIRDRDIDELRDLVATVYDTMSANLNPIGQQQQLLDRISNQATFPRVGFRPVIGELLVAADGAFWIERLDMVLPAVIDHEKYFGYISRLTRRATVWDVFGADGHLVGTVRLPPSFNPMDVTQTSVTGVLKDDLDVEYVVQYTVTAETGAE